MTTHDQVDELIAAYSLGAVDEAEAGLVRQHLPGCPECQRTLLRMTEVVAVLPLSLEEVEPPAMLRERILAGVTAPQGAAASAAGRALAVPSEGRLVQLRRVPRWAPLAAAAALLAVMFGWNLSLQTRSLPAPAPGNIEANLVDSGHSGVGTVTYLKDQHVALVSFHSLTRPTPGKNYELWVIPSGGTPQPAGVFLPEPDGSKVLVVNRGMVHGDTVAVTEEPPGGSPRPSGTPVISGRL
jgi:anti-sigma-K factor RskA